MRIVNSVDLNGVREQRDLKISLLNYDDSQKYTEQALESKTLFSANVT